MYPLLFIITKAAYSAGTKKQKMVISRTIVDDIYSKEPPGRFLKECPDTGQWIELSRREAADKAAQAMAYTVRNANSPKKASKKKKRKAPSSSSTTAAATSKKQEGTVKMSSSTQRTDQSLPSPIVGYPVGSVAAMSASSAITASTNNPPPPSISSLQQQIFSLLLQQSSTSLPATSSATSQNELLAQLLLVTQQQQQQIQLQQLVLSQLLASLTAPAPVPPVSAHILRQIIDAAQQGNIGAGLLPASLTAQSQANLQPANPSYPSSIFGAATNPNPLTGAQQQLDDQVYRASVVHNQLNQSLLMPSPPNSMSSNNAALSSQQQSQPQQQPPSTSSSPSSKE